MNVDVAIPSSRSVPVSLNHGSADRSQSDPRSPVSLAMLQLVRRVAPQSTPADTPALRPLPQAVTP